MKKLAKICGLVVFSRDRNRIEAASQVPYRNRAIFDKFARKTRLGYAIKIWDEETPIESFVNLHHLGAICVGS